MCSAAHSLDIAATNAQFSALKKKKKESLAENANSYSWHLEGEKAVPPFGAPQLIAGYEDSSTIKPRQFEVWLTPDALDNLCINNSSPLKKIETSKTPCHAGRSEGKTSENGSRQIFHPKVRDVPEPIKSLK